MENSEVKKNQNVFNATSPVMVAEEASQKPLLRVKSLKKYFNVKEKGFRTPDRIIKAVDGVSFDLMQEEAMGVVGESGCGKTTMGRTILRALMPTSGEVFLDCGDKIIDLCQVSRKQLKYLRPKMQMIFQDPYSSLNPRMTISDIVGEPLKVNKLAKGSELCDRVDEMLVKVGLKREHRGRYPHAFSGGQRQRIGIARALITKPSLIVADEAVSALDVSVQAQILNLLHDLKNDFGLTYMFVAHDLSVVRYLCDTIAVMYCGTIVELARTNDLYDTPKHPYTYALLSAVPEPNPRKRMKRIMLGGEIADPGNPPSGCRFHPRCQYAKKGICDVGEPPVLNKLSDGRGVACHLVDELDFSRPVK